MYLPVLLCSIAPPPPPPPCPTFTRPPTSHHPPGVSNLIHHRKPEFEYSTKSTHTLCTLLTYLHYGLPILGLPLSANKYACAWHCYNYAIDDALLASFVGICQCHLSFNSNRVWVRGGLGVMRALYALQPVRMFEWSSSYFRSMEVYLTALVPVLGKEGLRLLGALG